jgi:hypothetical protein
MILNLNKHTILIVIIHHITLSPECWKYWSFTLCFYLLQVTIATNIYLFLCRGKVYCLQTTHFAPDAMEFHIQTSHSIYTVILISSTSGAGTTYPSGAHEFKPGISGVRVTRS